MNTKSQGVFQVYLMVLYKGTIFLNYNATWTQLHEANFVVIKKDDQFLIWKDRFDTKVCSAKPKLTTLIQACERANKHLTYIALSQECRVQEANELGQELCNPS